MVNMTEVIMHCCCPWLDTSATNNADCFAFYLKIWIQGTVGTSYSGDISIDDISFKPRICAGTFGYSSVVYL